MRTENRIRPITIVRMTEPSMAIFTYLDNFKETAEGIGAIWYIEGTDENIIVDTGGIADILTKQGFPSEQVQEPKDGLKEVGLEPEDIDKIIVTHLHHDHAVFGNRYSNATLIVQRREYAFAWYPHPSFVGLYHPVQDVLRKGDFELVEGTSEIAEGIRVHLTPGHSPGAQSVEISTAEGKAIITGFCAIDATFDPPKEIKEAMGIYTPGIHTNTLESYDSALWVKRNADILVPNHEPRFEGKVIPDDL